MKATLYKTFTFEAAHRLPRVPAGHKCGRLHGHSYTVRVEVTGRVTPAGWVMDFGAITDAVRPIIDLLDHQTLNDIEGLANPTSELLAAWLYDLLGPRIRDASPTAIGGRQYATARLSAIEVSETCTSGVRYTGDLR